MTLLKQEVMKKVAFLSLLGQAGPSKGPYLTRRNLDAQGLACR